MVEMEALQLREIWWNVTTVQAMVDGNIECNKFIIFCEIEIYFVLHYLPLS